MGRETRKTKSGKTGGVAPFRNVKNGESETQKKPQNGHDSPLKERLFTRKSSNNNALEGALQDRCKLMPEGKRFQPGVSGNPAGRPRTADLKNAVREFADEEDQKLNKTRLRQWLEMADRRARQGSPKHLELLLAYGWGRPLQQQITLTADLPPDDEYLREIQQAVAEIRGQNGSDDSKLPVV